ncbi:MAG: hypothetical protein KJN93_03320 [Alphaproteobacteria bacterium]|nr:hypothetical protein [Alphaproteobacteria bacterium]NNF24044.1 hypothetical protein [Paracoccaceae bacterium]
MRNAATVLGILGGCLALIVGFFSFGYTEAVDRWGEHLPEVLRQVDNVGFIRTMAVVAPLLGIAGGAMARYRALWGGVLMLASTAGVYWAFGFSVFTVFPMAFCALGGILAIAAGRPDEPKSHF